MQNGATPISGTDSVSAQDSVSAISTTPLIITTKEARKFLGANCKDMPDEMVVEIIITMSRLSTNLLNWQLSSTKS